jgi:hypothetical protein
MRKPAYEEPEFDFENGLPPGREFFRLSELAGLWRCHPTHVQRLIDSGELPVAVDLRSPGTSKAMQRVTRDSVVKFLNRRKSGAPTL